MHFDHIVCINVEYLFGVILVFLHLNIFLFFFTFSRTICKFLKIELIYFLSQKCSNVIYICALEYFNERIMVSLLKYVDNVKSMCLKYFNKRLNNIFFIRIIVNVKLLSTLHY